jgi:hypothetical protein
MQLIVAFYLEDADIRESPYDAPEVLPLACPLKLCSSLVLELPEPLDRFSVKVRWNPDFDLDMKEHKNILFLIRSWRTWLRWSSTLCLVDDRRSGTSR